MAMGLLIGEQLGGRNDDMVFLGYIIGRGTSQALGHMLQTARMPLIFDLDETLLVASSSSQLEQKMEEACRRRCGHKNPYFLVNADMK